jgi:hypothetical protein
LDYVNNTSQNGKHITVFIAIKRDYGFQIQVAGCASLDVAQNDSKKIISAVLHDDQEVPVLDAREEASDTISDLSCIVLFENIVGQTTIITGRLYDNVCQVYDLIIECMDNPQIHDRLYLF